MSFFKPDEDHPQHPFIPRKLLLEEQWGEVWHVLHRQSATTMILVAWCTPDGDALFGEIAAGIQRWQELAGSLNCPHLLKIVELSDSAIPYVLVEDPGGLSLRDTVSQRSEAPKPEAIGKLAFHLVQAIHESEVYDCAPLALTPDCIYVCPADGDTPFKLLPISPRVHKEARQLSGGRYLPPDMITSTSVARLHADIYSIGLIIADVWRRDFTAPLPKSTAEIIPLKGLASLLDSLLKHVQGTYPEPAVASQSFDRWLKKQMAADVAAHELAEKERRRGPLLTFFVRRAKLLIGAAVFLFVASGTGFGVYYYLTTRPKPKVEVAALVKTEPGDVATLYLRAIEEGDASLAADAMMGNDLVEQTESILTLMEGMRPGAPADKIERQMAGTGDLRIVEAQISGQTGGAYALIVFEMRRRANFEWYVSQAFVKPLG